MSIETADIAEAKLPSSPMPEKPGGIAGQMYLPSDFDEVKLYALLKWRFKKPNGFLTFLGRPGGDPDGPFKWDFLFVPCDNLTVQIIRGIDGIEVWWWGEEVEKQQILDYLLRNLSKYSEQINEEIQTLEKYTLILNPFVRHRSIVALAKEELENIKPRKPTISKGFKKTKKEIEKYGKQFQAYMGKVQKQASATLLLVLESAFMAESYLNLILAFMLRPEIQTSKSILEETLLRKWRSKVEHLPVDCNYIKSRPDMGDVRIRDAKKMFDLRNKIAHSYPDRKAMKVGEMWFQYSFPILPKAEPFNDFTLALHNQLPSVEDALFCARSAERFIDFLTELIDEKVRDEFKFAAESNPLGFNETKGIFSVPFGKDAIIIVGGY